MDTDPLKETFPDGCDATLVWGPDYLHYDFGEHPMTPVRLDLTVGLARRLGVLDQLTMATPHPASEAQLLEVHSAQYLAAVRAASKDPGYLGHGLGSDDNPVFDGMFDAAALISGGSRQAALEVWEGRRAHAVNIAGGLHHAMRDSAAGFCVLNDVVVAIRALLDAGAQRVAYVDVDVHHGDGVQAAFYNDPRVLTISLHQDPRTLYPGTGQPTETGTGAGEGSSINLALPPATSDDGWLRAFNAVVPGALTAFKPEILVSQCGCDTHHEDPLADLALTVDGQRSAYAAMHVLAHQFCEGRWVALGGGGYGVLRCVPRTWTHLLAEVSGRRVDPSTEIPQEWTDDLRRRGVTARLPQLMGEGRLPTPARWIPGGDSWLDRAIGATRHASFPLLGLDPDDPRD
ncbi:acetoin utilization protein AcuC [Jatrophihabitans telluris]|uniref:Acetoin utilization protein AcuC n=1 Tax=Jatrophihabitans telluris TaxID=2038343 RepID=A0ABY4R1R6_9ACTN|nr:acetoin utilization protein AcuC [Jatrophihabitans telluris]UQX89447.1 acetoin utilization protein AcuC [Jatrophihabitans telluris]